MQIYNDEESSFSNERLQAAVAIGTLGDLKVDQAKELLLSATTYQFSFIIDMIKRDNSDIETLLVKEVDQPAPKRPDDAYKPTFMTTIDFSIWNTSHRRRQNAAAAVCILRKTDFNIDDINIFTHFKEKLANTREERSRILLMLGVTAYDGPIRTKAWAQVVPGMLSNDTLVGTIKPAILLVEETGDFRNAIEVAYWLRYLLRNMGKPNG